MGALCALPSPRPRAPRLAARGSPPAFLHLEPSRNSASFWLEPGCVVGARGPRDPEGCQFQDCGFGVQVSRPCPGAPEWVGREGDGPGGVQPSESHLEPQLESPGKNPDPCEVIWDKSRGPLRKVSLPRPNVTLASRLLLSQEPCPWGTTPGGLLPPCLDGPAAPGPALPP